ncbi:MAG: EVE domain-containing protein [Mycobacterium sp.]
MPKRSVTLASLGAWVIKCNPRKTSVEVFRAAGQAKSTWCVADNYRSRLIRPGHRVLFWVAAHPQRGIWGAGRVIGDVFIEGGQLHVPVHLPLFAEPLTAGELSELPTMEVFRSPQQANPSWVSVEELAMIEPLLPPGHGLT